MDDPMDPLEFQVASTDDGHDVCEGEMHYRIQPWGDGYNVVEYLAGEYDEGDVLYRCKTREEAETKLRERVRWCAAEARKEAADE